MQYISYPKRWPLTVGPIRFWSKVQFTESCWLWSASTASGYGLFWTGSKLVPAHRWAYEFCIGPIPEGLVIDHLCFTRNCVLPDHLEAITNKENILRGAAPSAIGARMDCCAKGHAFTKVDSRGKRVCEVCERLRWKAK